MKLTALLVGIEISDQYGTERRELVGVFDNEAAISSAKEVTEKKYRCDRIYFKEVPVTVNEIIKADE